MKDLRVREFLGWMDGWVDEWMSGCLSVCLFVCLSVCVYHLNRCKTSIFCRGATAHLPMLPNEATEDVVDGFMDA